MDTPPFSELGLPEELLAAVESLGFERPSPIQALSIPVALSGVDLLGLSQTGSGKTAAFTLPVLARIDLKSRSPQALIVCPTRELAVQVCEEVHRLGSQMRGLRAVPVYGGAPMGPPQRWVTLASSGPIFWAGRVKERRSSGTVERPPAGP